MAGVLDFEDLILCGDDSAWDIHDWNWDPASLTAAPRYTDSPTLKSEQDEGDLQLPGIIGCCPPHDAAVDIVSQYSYSTSGQRASTMDGIPSASNDNEQQLELETKSPTEQEPPQKGQRRRSSPKAASVEEAEDSEEYSGGSGGQGRAGVPTCQVEACGRDLSHLTTYHQRCRICEVHIKLPSFMRHGKLQRFCQQCGRCHELAAFDSGKRSCRNQLAKHNARRRKRMAKGQAGKAAAKADDQADGQQVGSGSEGPASPQQRTRSRNSADLLRPQALQATSLSNGSALYGLDGPSIDQAALEHLQRVTMKERAGGRGRPCMAASMLGARLSEGFAAPLLRMAPPAQQQQDAASINGDEEGGEMGCRKRRAASQLAPTSLGPSGRTAASALSLMGLGAPASGGLLPELQGLLQQTLAQPQQQQLQSGGLDFANSGMGFDPAGALGLLGPNFPSPPQPSTAQDQLDSSFEQALMMMARQRRAAVAAHASSLGLGPLNIPMQHPYQPENFVMRLSIKLFDCTPAELPSDLRDQLTGWLKATPAGAEGYMRPGCVHVTLQALLDKDTHTDTLRKGVRPCVSHLMQRDPALWKTRVLMVQLANEVALVREGEVLHIWTLPELATTVSLAGTPTLPAVYHVEPIAITSHTHQMLEVMGENISGEECTVLCRAHGSYIPLAEGPSVAVPASGCSLEVLRRRLPDTLAPGIMYVEVQKGAFMGEAQPVLVMEEGEVVGEVAAHCAGLPLQAKTARDALLLDLGALARHCHLVRQRPAPRPFISDAAATATARRLLAYACQEGLPILAGWLLPLAAPPGGSVGSMAAAVEETMADGLTLLHRAVQSGNPTLLKVLLEWGREHNHVWQAGAPGPAGITALHLAALLPPDSPIPAMLVQHCSPGPAAWFSMATKDGLKPAHFASRAGCSAINAAMMQMLPAAGVSGSTSTPSASATAASGSTFAHPALASGRRTPEQAHDAEILSAVTTAMEHLPAPVPSAVQVKCESAVDPSRVEAVKQAHMEALADLCKLAVPRGPADNTKEASWCDVCNKICTCKTCYCMHETLESAPIAEPAPSAATAAAGILLGLAGRQLQKAVAVSQASAASAASIYCSCCDPAFTLDEPAAGAGGGGASGRRLPDTTDTSSQSFGPNPPEGTPASGATGGTGLWPGLDAGASKFGFKALRETELPGLCIDEPVSDISERLRALAVSKHTGAMQQAVEARHMGGMDALLEGSEKVGGSWWGGEGGITSQHVSLVVLGLLSCMGTALAVLDGLPWML